MSDYETLLTKIIKYEQYKGRMGFFSQAENEHLTSLWRDIEAFARSLSDRAARVSALEVTK
jgi:hypothetical protein